MHKTRKIPFKSYNVFLLYELQWNTQLNSPKQLNRLLNTQPMISLLYCACELLVGVVCLLNWVGCRQSVEGNNISRNWKSNYFQLLAATANKFNTYLIFEWPKTEVKKRGGVDWNGLWDISEQVETCDKLCLPKKRTASAIRTTYNFLLWKNFEHEQILMPSN